MDEEQWKAIAKEKCQGITKPEEMKMLCESMHPQIVERMLNKYREEILVGKKPVESPTIYIIGGQNASGKSKLIGELESAHSNTVSIIIDDMKAHHPFREYIDQQFPDESEDLLHMACFEVFDRLLGNLLDDRYNVTIERTLGSKEKTRRFLVDPANHGYNIQMHVTATHEINSLLSSLERFMLECELKDEFDAKKSDLKIAPRPIGLKHHDDTYANICDVIQSAESGFFVDSNGRSIMPCVYVWDRTPERPTNIYMTGDRSYSNVSEAMYQGRQNDLARCKSDTEYGVESRVRNIMEEMKDAEPNSTLALYRNYCGNFLKEILNRTQEHIKKKLIL